MRGTCCCLNFPFEGHNILLDNVKCINLDPATGLCKDYKNRDTYPWCLEEYGNGNLPKGCLLLKEHPELEPNPKVVVTEVINTLPREKQLQLVGLYNYYNNIPFEWYLNYLIKKEGKT